MPDGIDAPDWLVWLILAGGFALAVLNLGRLAAALRAPTGRLMGWLATIARDAFIEGAQDGIRAIVSEELGSLRREMRDVKDQVERNGGSSLHDAVARIESQVNEQRRSLDRHIEDSVLDRGDLRRWLEHVDPGRQTDPQQGDRR